MALRTYISLSVRNDQVEAARDVLRNLAPSPLGPVEVSRSNDPEGITGLAVSLPGDQRDSVEQELSNRDGFDFEYEVYVQDYEQG